MTETIIVAIITFVGSLIGNYFSNNKNFTYIIFSERFITYNLVQL